MNSKATCGTPRRVVRPNSRSVMRSSALPSSARDASAAADTMITNECGTEYGGGDARRCVAEDLLERDDPVGDGVVGDRLLADRADGGPWHEQVQADQQRSATDVMAFAVSRFVSRYSGANPAHISLP